MGYSAAAQGDVNIFIMKNRKIEGKYTPNTVHNHYILSLQYAVRTLHNILLDILY